VAANNRTNNGRDAKGRYVKGNCGNPHGRPLLPTELRELAQAKGADALKLFIDLMEVGTTEEIRLKAAEKLLDRGYGKATQPIAGDSDMPPIEFIEVVRDLGDNADSS